MNIIKVLILLFSVLLLTSCTATNPQTGEVIISADEYRNQNTNFIQFDLAEGQEIATFTTSLGEIKMALFTDLAPNTVTHFKKLITNGFYDDKSIFLEGDLALLFTGAVGDDVSVGEVATPDGKKVAPEFITDVLHFTGAVSTYGEAESRFNSQLYSDSRFFIVGYVPPDDDIIAQMNSLSYPYDVVDMYNDIGGVPQYTNKYTVFGQVYEGLDIVNQITSYADGSSVKMLDDIKIISATIGIYELN